MKAAAAGACLAAVLALAGMAAAAAAAQGAEGAAGAAAGGTTAFAKWKNGPPSDPAYFPIAVWLQDAKNAPRYKAAGINLYIGLWQGPTEEQLADLAKAAMPVVCEQNAVGLKHKDDPIIVGWMHGDEPDNAQSLGEGKGYGPPIEPEVIAADYERIRRADPTRPVVLNLGQGVAWDGWYGRGERTNHPEDYPEYAKGGDVISFDIYPVAHPRKEVQGKLWYVAHGVQRLCEWTKGEKIVWNCIECTRIGEDTKATPRQVKAEVWMALVHGSTGLVWFVHEWKPKFCEWALLEDPEMLAAVTAINRQIASLAPVLSSPTVRDGATVSSEKPEVPIDLAVKRHGGATYVFAVGMRDGQTRGTFKVAGLKGKQKVEVLGEDRALDAEDGAFEDAFKPWDVHVYAIR